MKGTLQPVCEDIKAKLRGLCPEVTPQEKCDGDGYCDTTTKGMICEPSQWHDDGKAATVVLPGDQAGITCTSIDECAAGKTSEVSDLEKEDSITKVNLDITTVICLISNLCHGHCNYMFQDDVLSFQAEQERKESVLPALHKFMQG